MNLAIEFVKNIILILMITISICAIYLSIQLRMITLPILRRLSDMHIDDKETVGESDPWLQRIQLRYEELIGHVDTISTAEFSAGEIETLPLRFFKKRIKASAAQAWLKQTPSVLISLGLLGTFVGLTVGLSQISSAFAGAATPEETVIALNSIIAPMGAAFQTSLLGLFLSLIISVWSYLNGTHDCLERCELLLSSWLETILPRRLGSKLMTPLRKSIENLNLCVNQLPENVMSSIAYAMNQAFASKLDDMFNSNSLLAEEARTSIRQISSIANALNESGQDFLRASQGFQYSDFASSLQQSVQSLTESRELISSSSEGLSEKLLELREGLQSVQSEWKILAKVAEYELETCRTAVENTNNEMLVLRKATQNLEAATILGTEASKQLKEARLEVMRDRKLAIDVAETIKIRLEADTNAVNACQSYTSILENAMINWNKNLEELNILHAHYVNSAINGRLEDANYLESNQLEVKAAFENLKKQLVDDIGSAVQDQYIAIREINEPAREASDLNRLLLLQLEDLRSKIQNIRTKY